MWAYRIYDENRGVWIEENDDDGESAAGSRMALLVSDYLNEEWFKVEYYERQKRDGGGVAMVGRDFAGSGSV